MIKLLGCLMLAAAGYGAGAWRLAQRQRHLAGLRQLYRVLGRIWDEIEFRALPTGEILRLLQQDPGLALLELDRCERLQAYSLPELFTPEERSAFDPAFRALGQGTSPESCRMLAYYQRRCMAFTERAEKSAEKAKRLYRPFGLCTGLLVALLLL